MNSYNMYDRSEPQSLFEMALLPVKDLEFLFSHCGVSPNDYYENTPLLHIILQNETSSSLIKQKLELFEKYDADMSILNKDTKENAFFFATTDLFEYFTKHNVNINQVNKHGNTPFLHRLNSLPAVTSLIKFGAEIPELIWEHTYSQTNVLNYLIDLNLIDIHKKNKNDEGILFFATRHTLIKIIDQFDVNQRNIYGRTPIFKQNSANTIQLLLSKGADINATDNNGNNALFYCSDSVIADVFLDNGIDINHLNNKGQNILFHQRYIKIFKKILNQGGNPLQLDNDGNNILYPGASEENLQFYKSLGIDINHQNKKGEHILFRVKEFDDFLDYKKMGANIEIVNNEGYNVFTKKVATFLSNEFDIHSLKGQELISDMEYLSRYTNSYIRNEEEFILFRNKLKDIINVKTIIGQGIDDSSQSLFDKIEVVYQSLIEKKDLQNIFNTSLIQKNHNKNRM